MKWECIRYWHKWEYHEKYKQCSWCKKTVSFENPKLKKRCEYKGHINDLRDYPKIVHCSRCGVEITSIRFKNGSMWFQRPKYRPRPQQSKEKL